MQLRQWSASNRFWPRQRSASAAIIDDSGARCANSISANCADKSIAKRRRFDHLAAARSAMFVELSGTAAYPTRAIPRCHGQQRNYDISARRRRRIHGDSRRCCASTSKRAEHQLAACRPPVIIQLREAANPIPMIPPDPPSGFWITSANQRDHFTCFLRARDDAAGSSRHQRAVHQLL